MIEEFIATMPLLQKITAYAFLLVGLLIFVQTGKIRIFGKSLIPMKWRIGLALLFPVIFVLGILFGAVILGIGIALLGIAMLSSILTGKKPKMPKLPRVRINVVRKQN